MVFYNHGYTYSQKRSVGFTLSLVDRKNDIRV